MHSVEKRKPESVFSRILYILFIFLLYKCLSSPTSAQVYLLYLLYWKTRHLQERKKKEIYTYHKNFWMFTEDWIDGWDAIRRFFFRTRVSWARAALPNRCTTGDCVCVCCSHFHSRLGRIYHSESKSYGCVEFASHETNTEMTSCLCDARFGAGLT